MAPGARSPKTIPFPRSLAASATTPARAPATAAATTARSPSARSSATSASARSPRAGATRRRPQGAGRVAIVGGGPSGLSAAYQLRRRGYAVTIFEAQPELGGLLRDGIPPYRLPRAVLDGEIERDPRARRRGAHAALRSRRRSRLRAAARGVRRGVSRDGRAAPEAPRAARLCRALGHGRRRATLRRRTPARRPRSAAPRGDRRRQRRDRRRAQRAARRLRGEPDRARARSADARAARGSAARRWRKASRSSTARCCARPRATAQACGSIACA